MKQSNAMYPPPNSGLTRYGSAPGSLLTSIADSVISEGAAPAHFCSLIGSPPPDSSASSSAAAARSMTRFFTSSGAADSSPCLTSESTCNRTLDVGPASAGGGVQHRYPPFPPHTAANSVGEILGASADHKASGAGGGGGPHLLRHSSSPAGFFSHLMVDNGFSVTRGMGHYSQPANGVHTMPSSRLKSQLSFSRQDLSQISEMSIPEMGESMVGGNSPDETGGNVGQSYISSNYSIGSWDDTNSIAFSAPLSKRAKESNDDLLNGFSHLDSQFSLPTTSLEMATVEKLLQSQQDSVSFKVRAKRGCATHPRSIAERERRTRISEKLRKLQELVPNMDKQTSTADMLDLAVQHIKGLQGQVQTLNQERANCTCAAKEEIQSGK